MQGVDISMFQPNYPADWYRQWGFVVCKATEGTSYVDPTFSFKFPMARANCAVAGAYHYGRPGHGSATEQADHFADTCLAQGFRPGVDIWQLDCEGQGNDAVTVGQWVGFIAEFHQRATERLGDKGTLYVGYYFWLQQMGGSHDALAVWKWWLPWYGPNDGGIHLPTPLLPQPAFIQQFTSAGGLDRNFVDDAAWAAWFQKAPAPAPTPEKVQTGGKTVNLTHAKAKTITLNHQGFGLFHGVWDTGVPLEQCLVTANGPAPAADGWWDATIEGHERAQVRGTKVIVTAFYPKWVPGGAEPAVHVLAIPA